MSEDDLVRRRAPRKRIELSVTDLADEGQAPEVSEAADEIVLRSAAVLCGDRRIPIPGKGLTLGASNGADLTLERPDIPDVEAVIEPTETGHVIVELGGGGTYLNGERLVVGERRPLERGDSLAVGGKLLHYLPSGEQMPRLAPITPVQRGLLRTSKQVFTIGRDPGCDLVLDHPTVSREHAVIRVDRGVTTIEDRGSATGLRVNGEPIRRAILAVGDQIAVGPFRIVFDGTELFERAATEGLAVSAVGVQVDAGATTILQPTDLQLRPGELVAIIGQSGAGKTTLLRTLAGVSPPTRGRVLLGGDDVQQCLSELGYVPQFDIVHGQLTVREALDFAARLRLPPDTQDAERFARVQDIIAKLELADRADVRIDQLSGGQRKRVAVGIELLHRPGVLFLDEPTTGLDPALERHMMDLFRSIAQAGQTVVLTTHATGSMAMCDRIVVLAPGGRRAFDGAPDELLEAFRVDHFDEVYGRVSSAADPEIRLVRPTDIRRPARLPPIVPPLAGSQYVRRPMQHTIQYQTKVLASRYATLLLRDQRHLRSAFIQVPIVALLTALLFNREVFTRLLPGDPAVQVFASKAAQVIFLMVTIAIWLGSINAAREIVKERTVLARERAVGVQLPAYLASKLIVLLGLVTAQTTLFAVIVFVLRPLHESSGVEVQLLIVLAISGWIAVLLGLVVSAFARSEDQATGIIPLLLVPQLLFGGAIVPLTQMSIPMKVIAALVPARWAFAAAGHTIHMQQRINEDPVFSQISKYGQHFFSVPFPVFVLIAGAFGTALCAVLMRLLKTAAAPNAPA